MNSKALAEFLFTLRTIPNLDAVVDGSQVTLSMGSGNGSFAASCEHIEDDPRRTALTVLRCFPRAYEEYSTKK